MPLRSIVILLATAFTTSVCAQTAQDEMKRLDGTWAFVSGYEKGRHAMASSNEKARAFRVIFRGSNVHFRPAEPPFQNYVIGVFPQMKPKAIDLRDSQGTAQGIYELSGDALKLRIGNLGHPRPSSFALPPTENELILVLKRER